MDLILSMFFKTEKVKASFPAFSLFPFFPYLNMDKALENSTPVKVAYIWRIERFQIDAVKFSEVWKGANSFF